MRISSLRHFIQLAEAGSFYRAAKIANLTAQGLSKSLSSMENELGVTLVIRSRQ